MESERRLANYHGTFYELPLISNGQPADLTRMRPVASHTKAIYDFCSWNGLLVLTGVGEDAAPDGHVFADAGQRVGLWFGGVDDLWKLGKPVGTGGPWKDSHVKANEPSDAYLMTGYDKKTLDLTADRDVIVTVQIDFDHQSRWHTYQRFALKAGVRQRHTFPEGFSAHWLRVVADADCVATAWLTYE